MSGCLGQMSIGTIVRCCTDINTELMPITNSVVDSHRHISAMTCTQSCPQSLPLPLLDAARRHYLGGKLRLPGNDQRQHSDQMGHGWSYVASPELCSAHS